MLRFFDAFSSAYILEIAGAKLDGKSFYQLRKLFFLLLLMKSLICPLAQGVVFLALELF